MEPNNLASHANAGVDRAASKLHNGIRNAHEKADGLGAQVADKADAAVSQAKSKVKEGIQSVKDAVQQGRGTVAQSSETVVSYTRDNPVKALLIAAVSGAVVWSLAKALASSRD